MPDNSTLAKATTLNLDNTPQTINAFASSNQNYVAKEVIVKFKTPAQIVAETGTAATRVDINAERASLLGQLNATVVEETQTLGIERWRLDSMSVEDAIAQYGQHAAIEYIELSLIHI